MSCGLAPAISAGTNVVVGNDATYTCNTGYKMDGRPQVHCIGGTWTGTPPTCFLLNAEPTNNYWLDVFNTQDESKSNGVQENTMYNLLSEHIGYVPTFRLQTRKCRHQYKSRTSKQSQPL
jgi:hypothetical protein